MLKITFKLVFLIDFENLEISTSDSITFACLTVFSPSSFFTIFVLTRKAGLFLHIFTISSFIYLLVGVQNKTFSKFTNNFKGVFVLFSQD